MTSHRISVPRRRLAAAASAVLTATLLTAGSAGAAEPAGGTARAAASAWSGQFTGYGSSSWRTAWGVASSGTWGGSQLRGVSVPGAPGDGSALQVTYGAGSSASSCTDCPNPGGGQFYTDLKALGLGKLAESATLDLKYYARFPAGQDWGKAGKLPGLYGGTIGEESGGNHGNGWSTRFMWRMNSSAPNNGEVYLYTPTNSGPTGYGVDLGVGSWKWVADGNWHSIEQSVNRSTGDVTVWYDGKQVFAARKAATGIGSIPFGGVFFSTFYGGHDTSWGPKTTQHAYFADFSLATSVQH
ncbi:polysaccharide lyase [Kitasatospora sp. NPDC001175]|uniref:polysaccharide lyase n=1 Tax=Kitasatospora sp. NPDC001175 TaxID=3157103 RepID=UPI003D06625D